MDLVCHRYPQRRPSDYLELDSWTALQLDVACAISADREEKEFYIELVSSINENLVNVMRALGANVEYKRPQKRSKGVDEIRPLAEVISELSGAGVAVVYKKKDV